MAINRQIRALDTFSMASMTDVIFLLLIFFMVLSTLVVPNAIKINLPSSRSSAPEETIDLQITLTAEGDCYLGFKGRENEEIPLQSLGERLKAEQSEEHPLQFAALYADEEVQYREIVYVLNAANEADIRLLLATKALKE